VNRSSSLLVRPLLLLVLGLPLAGDAPPDGAAMPREAVAVEAPELDPAFRSLRDRVLGLTAEDLGTLAPEPVWAALLEIGFPEGSASLVVAVDGTTSLYYSTGGGVLGTGEFAEVRLAARTFLLTAAESLSALEKSAPPPPPGDGRLQFLILTAEGLWRAETTPEAIEAEAHPLAALSRAGQQVLGRIRMLEERSPADAE
jgi:hypothetical protein